MSTQSNSDQECLLTKSEVAKLLRLSSWTVARMVAQGRFPKPIRLTNSTLRWLNSEVVSWMRAMREKS